MDVRPAALRFPFVNDLLESGLRESRVLELVANDVFELACVEGDDHFLESRFVHVRGKRSVGDGRVRGRDHLSPGTDMLLIDIFDNRIAQLRNLMLQIRV